MRIVALVGLALGWFMPRAAFAQAPRVIRVVDDSLQPVAGATATLVDSLGRTVRATRTDSGGRVALVWRDTTARQIDVRRIGFVPAAIALRWGSGDTLVVRLTRSIAVLDEIVTSGRRSSKDYAIGAREIAASTRGLFTGLDVLTKLRPQMLGDALRGCGAADKIWINGVRVYFFPGGDAPATRRARQAGSVFAQRYAIVDTVLSTIRAEDIAQVTYTNCWDRQPEGIQRDALYIVLKPGVEWDWKHGSFHR